MMRSSRLERLLIIGALVAGLAGQGWDVRPCNLPSHTAFRSPVEESNGCCPCGCAQGQGCGMSCCRSAPPQPNRDLPAGEEHRTVRDALTAAASSLALSAVPAGADRQPLQTNAFAGQIAAFTLCGVHVRLQV